ncbi:pyridoxamine 5'-phosphate oxidase family protein [Anaerosporobacter sp.]|uniref:pyridoxamine 5'-phosphate oxidase family protein n=1 Tax=Anaerosporobacter sp. TaxID=1872529 RepID=UPI00286EE803|nr:pyridoxamine 5'-phosphate oxidase family protein [Anaerosporobacter sp.]
MSIDNQEISKYITESQSIVLTTVDEEGNPDIRAIGGFQFEDNALYFGTGKDTNKVKQLEHNPNVTILVQHEGQKMPNFKNVTIYGKAYPVKEDEFQGAVDIIKKRRPQLNLDGSKQHVYKVIAEKLKIVDFSAPIKERIVTVQ